MPCAWRDRRLLMDHMLLGPIIDKYVHAFHYFSPAVLTMSTTRATNMIFFDSTQRSWYDLSFDRTASLHRRSIRDTLTAWNPSAVYISSTLRWQLEVCVIHSTH